MSGRTLSGVVQEARRRFAEAGLADPMIDARVLICGLLDLTPTDLVLSPDRVIDAEAFQLIEEAIGRRLDREPVHRILGLREFFGLDLHLSAGTLEPRPDTEILVETCLAFLQERDRPIFIDLGTGTGAIALALLSQCPQSEGMGVDLSDDALATACSNARKLGLSDRFKARQGNWAAGITDRFDLVVSNPPYIRSDVIQDLAPEVRLFDPILALDGGPDGLDAYREIAAQSSRLLKPDGRVALEIGYDQKESVTRLFVDAGFRFVEAVRDLGGNDRVLVFSADVVG